MSNRYFIIAIFFIIFSVSGLQAQEVNQQTQKEKVLANLELGSYSNQWLIYESLEMVDVYCKYSDCSDPANGFYPEYILFKVVNKTDAKVYVYWEYTANYNEMEDKSIEDENLVNVFLEPYEEVEGSCNNLDKTKLGIFVRFKNKGSVITNFNLNKINEFNIN